MVNLERLENNEVKLDLTISAETFAQALVTAHRKTGNRYTIPGFRKGKAPRKMIEKHYGEGVFYEEAFEESYWPVYMSAVVEAGITPVDAPNIAIDEIGEGIDCKFTVNVPVSPDVVVEDAQYKGIELEKVEYTVTDVQINAQIERERAKMVRWVDADNPIVLGNRVMFDYSGSIDGVMFDGGTAEDQTIDIGSDRFIPGFEEQMIGLEKGTKTDITVAFPEDYHVEELKGKQAIFALNIKEIKDKELPEVDDEFAKDVSEFDSLEEYKASIRAEMEKENEERSKSALRNAAVDAVIAKVEIDVPKQMIEHQIDHTIEDMSYRLRAQGMSMDDYINYTGMTLEKLREEMRPDSERHVRGDLVLAAIVKANDFKATEEEVEAEIAKLSVNAGKTVEEAKKLIHEDGLVAIREEIAFSKAIDCIVDNAVITAKKPDEKKSAQENNEPGDKQLIYNENEQSPKDIE